MITYALTQQPLPSTERVAAPRLSGIFPQSKAGGTQTEHA